ncbi:MAG: transglycosylase SLT domain-containing protein [Nevskia sp.]|nr:transglycosylase SLT domain-containing protein [Nevskia sp.]
MRLRVMLGALACLLAASAAAGPTGEPEPELRARLAQAFHDADGFEDPYIAQVWFADMTERMSRFAPRAMPDRRQRLDFLRLVHAEATRAKVSPELVLAVINAESGFDRLAISRAGAFGYMQIMPFWLEEIGQTGDNLFQARTNLRMGCTILRYYLDREHDSYVRALARYNGSSGRPGYPYLVLRLLNRRWFPA